MMLYFLRIKKSTHHNCNLHFCRFVSLLLFVEFPVKDEEFNILLALIKLLLQIQINYYSRFKFIYCFLEKLSLINSLCFYSFISLHSPLSFDQFPKKTLLSLNLIKILHCKLTVVGAPRTTAINNNIQTLK